MSTPPIVVRAGKVREKHIRQLQTKSGKVTEDVQEIMRLIRSDSRLEKEYRVFVPVVVVYSVEDQESGN